MATQVPPKKNTAYTFTVGLTSQANTKVFQSNPTLAVGDVKVRTDSGSLANITTLPSVVSSSKLVDVTLSASEMNGDRIQVLFSDASGDEWCDFIYEIDTTARTLDDGTKMADGVAHGGSTATMRLGSSSSTPALNITNSGGDAVQVTASGSNGNGLSTSGNGSGAGLVSTGGATGYGLHGVGSQGIRGEGTTSHGLIGLATGAGDGVCGLSNGGGAGIRGDHSGTIESVTTVLNRIGAFTGSGVNTVFGFLKAVMSKDASTPSDVGGTFSAATDALEALQEVIVSTGTGTGARTVTITVDDGTTALQNARVRLQQGAESYVANTNGSGVITFSVDDATWSVRITKAGYAFTPTTLVVNGDETQTYSMTSTAPAAPANPALATGSGYCYDESGVAEQGVTITCWMTAGTGDDGYHWDASEFTMTSDVNGLVSHAFVRGATYKANRGTAGRSVEFTVPTDSGNFDLPEVLGSP